MQAVPPEQLVALVAVFVSVALVVGVAAARILSARSPERRRLKEVVQAPHAPVTRSAGGDLGGNGGRDGWLPKSVRDMSGIERRLAMAGYRAPWTLRTFVAAQFIVPAILLVVALGVVGWASPVGWAAGVLAAAVGQMSPGLFLDRQIVRRRRQIANGLPDVLDLVIVCLEAGSSLDQAIVKASVELELAYPALAEELRLLTMETRAGKPRLEAFRNLAQRTKVDSMRALVAMLVQTDRFGTSVGQALRALADGMRTKRRQKAEEQAAKVGVKLVFPLVICLFPAFFIVILGPALLRLARAFAEMGR